MREKKEDIAIIGIAGRFPDAENIEQFWENLIGGHESVKFFSDEELKEQEVNAHLLRNPNYIKAASVLNDIEYFDADFFGYSHRDAETIDPQQRLFLELSWLSLENAGYDANKYKGKIGVFAGENWENYRWNNLYKNEDFLTSVNEYQILLGNDKDHLATRVSYKLNLNGPSVNIQTACSTSLVAVHHACKSLLSGESDMALAGGVSVRVPHKIGYLYQEGYIVSRDGHCRAFDEKASGTVFSSACGVIVLKKLKDAIKDRDTIHAVIKGSAINNDGSAKVGYTAPSVEGQKRVVSFALSDAQVDPKTITYIEAHGTGTIMGDPIEISALTRAFREKTKLKKYCALGSVKANIGHAGAASGIVGLIKIVLALKYKLLPPSINFDKPNPSIDFANSPFYINTKVTEWSSKCGILRAGISSFGMGGTNAHLILEEPPILKNLEGATPAKLLIFSAKTQSALELMKSNFANYLKSNIGLNISDVCYTLSVGRKEFAYRWYAIVSDINDAIKQLNGVHLGKNIASGSKLNRPSIVFMFPGQGSQQLNMALDLYKYEVKFRENVDQCAVILQNELGVDIRNIIYPQDNEIKNAEQKLHQTILTQPILFSIEYAFAKLLIDWGINPNIVIGHSIGEYVAACIAGVFSLSDALHLVAMRSKLTQKLPAGKMLAIFLESEKVKAFLNDDLSIAAINSPSLCVVSGPNQAVEKLKKHLDANDIECKFLHTSHAFHSKMVDPIVEIFINIVKKINLNTPKILWVSTVTGTYISNDEATDPLYWGKNLRQTVLFLDGIQKISDNSDCILLEVGPGQALSTIAKNLRYKQSNRLIFSVSPKVDEKISSINHLLETIGDLWLAETTIDWEKIYANEKRRRLSLPGYHFERKYCWINQQKDAKILSLMASSGKKDDIKDWFYVPAWKRLLINNQQTYDVKEKCILLFCNDFEFSDAILSHLNQQGFFTVKVLSGTTFSKKKANDYVINVKNPVDYDTLFDDLNKLGKIPDVIIHLLSLSQETIESRSIDTLKENRYFNFYSLLFLSQSLNKYYSGKKISINIVANGVCGIGTEDLLYPEKALLLGPCRVISQEYVNLRCKIIDIVLPHSVSEEKTLLANLLCEFFNISRDVVIAYRENHKWVQIFEPFPLENKYDRVPKIIRENGVYLLLGGLGGIGLEVAEYLVKIAKAKLVLTGRSYFPEKIKWKAWLSTHEESDSTSIKIRKIESLEKMGGNIIVLRADVTNLVDMQDTIKKIEKYYGELNGIIYAAGLPGGGMMQFKTFADADAVISSKLSGIENLDIALDNRKIDFLILFSSLASIWGGIGRVDYCAANAFLDAIAHYNNSHGKYFTISIDWDMWKEVGMGMELKVTENLEERHRKSMEHGILTSEGIDVFQRILFSNISQVIVSTQDLYRRIEEKNTELKTLSNNVADNNKNVTTSRLREQYLAPRNNFESVIANIWAKIFGFDQVGIFDNFFDLGGHSLLSTQLLNRLQKEYPGINLSLKELFDYPTVEKLAALIDKKYLQGQTNSNKTVKEIFNEIFPTEKLLLLKNYFLEKINNLLKNNPLQFTEDTDLRPFYDDNFVSSLLWDLKRDFNFVAYPYEILAQHTIVKMATFLLEELKKIEQVTVLTSKVLNRETKSYFDQYKDIAEQHDDFNASSAEENKNESMVFLLSSPRVGSTLLRLMLAGHSQLFCPPELHLLSFNNINEWSANRLVTFSKEGLVTSLMNLKKISFEKCKQLIAEMKKSNVSIKDVYNLIQEATDGRILLDKTPRYSIDINVLRKAEKLFKNPKYIYLIRHPYPVIQSFVNNRFHKLFTKEEVNPYLFAENIWTVYNRNILQFIEELGADRFFLIKYEELVTQPEQTLIALCNFLEIPFENGLLAPYDGKARMIDGPGDPNVFQHSIIDPKLADIWQEIKLPFSLEHETIKIATKFGYDVAKNPETKVKGKKQWSDEFLQKTLSKVQQLSDGEASKLLDDLNEDRS